ncbi:MAG TPA: hypothetical protein VF939_14370 [Puia sp.]
MKCEEIQSALMDLNGEDLHGEEMDPSRQEEIERHLQTCEKCAQDARELKTLLQLMEASPKAIPGAALRDNFAYMLRSESEKLAAAGLLKEAPSATGLPIRKSLYRGLSSWWKIAAVFLVLAVGIWIGMQLPRSQSRGQSAGTDSSPLAGRSSAGQTPDSSRGEITNSLLFTLLKEESASQRIRAVSYTEDISNPDQTIINALVGTLNHDKNVNVRLASLYSLARFPNNAALRDSLVRSLGMQTEPIVQIVLINLLTEMKEVKAIQPIRDIISDKKTLPDVKTIAEKGLRTL